MDKKMPLMIVPISPQSGALQRILTAVQYKQQQIRLWYGRVFAATAILSIVALVPAIIDVSKALAASNFSTYLSLIFSDGGVIASYWKELGLLLIGSLPAVSLAITLTLVIVCLWSLRVMARYNFAI